ncbi:MAG TPA: Hsp20/alpha crystallin family protein [Steroidobacteraceae bacterium]|nr:Hsp20/alpha crystallin family protein [Steroidobacteraceae bacterium]
MSLIRWEPFTTTDDLFARMPSMFGRWPRAFEFDGKRTFEWSPTVDISETDGEYLIRADLPAVKKEDVRITVDEGMLTISGERHQQTDEKKEKSHRVETVYGKFSRSFSLPDNTDAATIRAESKDGVITVHVAKAKAAAKKPTEIKVQ